MGMRPPTSENLDSTMPITSLRHPRTGEPVELPVVFCGGSYNLLLFASVFFFVQVGRGGPGRVGRAPVFCKSTLRLFSAIKCYPFMILLIANILHLKLKAQWLIRACCYFHPNIERCYIPVDVADPPPRLWSPPLTLK